MKSIIINVGCFVALGILFAGAMYAVLAKLDESNDRVAALEQQNNELQDELHSCTDALENDISSVTDATMVLEKDISDVNDDVEELKEKEEEREKEAEEAEKKKSEAKTSSKKASVSVPQPQAQPTVEVASEPELTESSSDTNGSYLGTYKCTGYVATGNPCANGNYPTSGYTVASNSLPMGTRVYIEGIGERVVEDTGGMSSGTLDVFCDSVDECYALTGNYDVYIIEE